MEPTEGSLDRYRLHAEVCRVLTDPKRLMLLDALRAGPRSVGELAEGIGVALPNASQHLAVLRSAGLVEGRRAGTSVVYRLAEPAIVEACDIIDGIVARRLGRTGRIAAGRPSAAPGQLPAPGPVPAAGETADLLQPVAAEGAAAEPAPAVHLQPIQG